MSTAISRHWTLEDCLRTSHLDIPNQLEQVFRYGRVHRVEQIRKDIERTARTILDPLCDKFGKGTMSSGYRCPALNRAVGGSSNSAHTVGLAFDWQPPMGVPIASAIIWTRAQPKDELDFDRLIVEERGKTRWLHVQAGEEGYPGARAVFHSPSAGLFVALNEQQILALAV